MPAPYSVRTERDVQMTTRDGVCLMSDIYRPDVDDRFPVLLIRNISSRRALAPGFVCQADRRAALGYIVVVQEVRGLHDSEGEFVPFIHEAEDSYDTIEWAATLPGSTGDVAMFGQSYSATAQYLVAPLCPPHLKTIVPVYGMPSAFMNFAYCNGVLELTNLMTYTALFAREADHQRSESNEKIANILAPRLPEWPILALRDEILETLPLAKLATYFSDTAPFIDDQLREEYDGPYWQATDIRGDLSEVDIPILHVGSWYDNHQYDTIAMYEGIHRQGKSEFARAHQYLLMAPFAHAAHFGGENHGNLGEVDFGPEASVDLFELSMEWFDHFLKGSDDQAFDKQPVQIFVTGKNVWRDESVFPPRHSTARELFLCSSGPANTRSGSGSLTFEKPKKGEPSNQYSYDPLHPVPTRGGRVIARPAGPMDQREIEDRNDVLVFTSMTLQDELEVIGHLEVVLHAASSACDTDFVAKLVDVHPDDSAQLLADGVVRARFRNSLDSPEPIKPGVVYEYHIDLWSISHVFLTGHRIRLEVTSSCFPRWNRNMNSGKPLYSDSTPIIAEQTIFHDATYPSRILLPVVPAFD